MSTLPTILNQTDVGRLVADQNRIYQPQGPRIPGDPQRENLPSNATPAAMLILIDALLAYTQEVQSAAADSGVTDDVVMGQWQSDMSHWVQRLNHYRMVVQSVDPSMKDSLAGADAIYFTVTSPLLDGYFYEALPGIVLNDEEKARMQEGPPNGVSNKKPPDVYVPFSLGNQVLVYRDHQRERWDQLWADVWENTKKLPGQVAGAVGKAGWAVAPWLVGAGVFLGSAALTGGIIYLVIQHQTAKRGAAAALAQQQMAGAGGASPAF